MFAIKKIWNKLFLDEKPSILLSFFRIPVAWTVLVVVVPSFFHLQDTFLPSAFKELNTQFFPIFALEMVQASPVWLIKLMVFVFVFSGLCFLIGLKTQISAVIVTLSCYYFYALNSFAIGTLSWDILLVTLVLMAVTSYPGDFFSLDSLLKKDVHAYKKTRPVFVQRLLQIQIATTFFMTALHKITIEGNWLSANPIFYLMNSPPQGVVKNFILKDVLRDLPHVCYGLGLFIIIVELLLPFLLFIKRTRIAAIYLGFLFHIVLILTLDVPATFFFIFPAQMLLFIDSNRIIEWIQSKQVIFSQSKRSFLLYDGSCGFCQMSLKTLLVLDIFHNIKSVDASQMSEEKLQEYHPELTVNIVKKQLCMVNPAGELYRGFFVFRALCWAMPLMTPWALFFYFPGSGLIGPAFYRLVANYRYMIMGKNACKDQCDINLNE